MKCPECGLDHGSHTHAEWESRFDKPRKCSTCGLDHGSHTHAEWEQRFELKYDKATRTIREQERVTNDQSDRVRDLEEALQELVALKHMHDRIEADKPKSLDAPRSYYIEELEEHYRDRKPKAWQRARELLGNVTIARSSTANVPKCCMGGDKLNINCMKRCVHVRDELFAFIDAAQSGARSASSQPTKEKGT